MTDARATQFLPIAWTSIPSYVLSLLRPEVTFKIRRAWIGNMELGQLGLFPWVEDSDSDTGNLPGVPGHER